MSCHIVLMIDTSGSMSGSRINLVNTFLSELKNIHQHIPTNASTLKIHLHTFESYVSNKGEITLTNIPTLYSRGGTNMIDSITTGFNKYKSLLVDDNVVFYFYLTDNTTSFIIPNEIYGLSADCKELEEKQNKSFFGFNYCLNINGLETVDLSLIFTQYLRVIENNLKVELDRIFAMILEVYNEAENTKEYKMRAKKMEEQSKDIQSTTSKINEELQDIDNLEIQAKVELDKILTLSIKTDRLYKVLTDFTTSELFLEGDDIAINVFITEHINKREDCIKELKQIEENYNNIQTKIQEKGKNLDVLFTEADIVIKKLQKSTKDLDAFVINESRLGPKIRDIIINLTAKLDKESEYKQNFTKIKFNSKLKQYQETLVKERDTLINVGDSTINEAKTFLNESKIKIQHIITNNPPEPKEKERIRQKLIAINTTITLLQETLKSLKDKPLDFSDYGLD